MGKIRWISVKEYAGLWEKTDQAIYSRINSGKMIAIPEPDGGSGKQVPVCECGDNFFPGRSLCIACKKEVEAKLKTAAAATPLKKHNNFKES